MKAQRLWWIVRTALCRGGRKRAAYAKRAGIYGLMGSNVVMTPLFIPPYSQLIRIHDNVIIARGVEFVTHNMISSVLNRIPEAAEGHRFREQVGCIEIMDNCFIGINSVIMHGVRIGPNVIVAAGSVVTRDCEPNSVYAGVPARRIGSFDDYVSKRVRQEDAGEITTIARNQAMTEEETRTAWRAFDQRHGSAEAKREV